MASYLIMDGGAVFARVNGVAAAPEVEGMVAVPVDAPAEAWTATLEGETYTVEPLPPSLADLRADRWALIKDARERAYDGGCMTPLGRVETDTKSRLLISGAVQMASIGGEAFTIDWTMADESTVTHDAAAMIALGLAVGQHINACHDEGKARRAALSAAETAEAIAAVPVDGGWPT